jgi:hypothetical protein
MGDSSLTASRSLHWRTTSDRVGYEALFRTQSL